MKTVLMVEDDPLFAALLQRAMARHGWRVLSAASAAEGMRRVRAEACDVLLLDLGLPDGSGWDVAVAAPQRLPVVVMTCRDVGSEEIRLFRPARVIQKPLALAELFHWLERCTAQPAPAGLNSRSPQGC